MATGAFDSNQGAFDPNVSLEHFRTHDKVDAVNPEGELIPEKETLNVRYVNDFLQKKGITPENFDTNFTLVTAIELTSAQHSKGEKEMFDNLSQTKGMLDKLNLPDLLESMNDSKVKSNIHAELEKRKELGNESKLLLGYNTYRVAKLYCDKMYKLREEFSNTRKEQQTEINTGIKEGFAGVLNSMKENFGKMGSSEKMLLVVGGIIGAGMLLGSDSPRVSKIKETIWTCMKIGGVAWLGNTLVKVFTGKTALQTVSDWSKSNVATMEFWTKAYKTNSEKAEILHASTMYLGDIEIMRLAKDYKKERDNPNHDADHKEISYTTISGKEMTPKQIYIALDTFFQTYPVDQMELKYAQWRTPGPATWREAIGNEMISDGKITMSDSLVSQAGAAVDSTFVRAGNYLGPKLESAADYAKSGKLAGAIGSVGKGVGNVVGQVAGGTIEAAGGVVLGTVGGVWQGAKGVVKGGVKGAGEVLSDVGEAAKEAKDWVRNLFRKNNCGVEGTEEQVLEWDNKYLEYHSESRTEELGTFLHEKIGDKKNADAYEKVLTSTQTVKVDGAEVQYKKTNDAIYVMSGSGVPNGEEVVGNEKGMWEARKNADAAARKFLTGQYPDEIGPNIDTYAEVNLGVWMTNEAKYKVFVRMPLPGTVEYNQRKVGHWTPEWMRSRTDVQKFGPDNKFEYASLQDWEKYNLQIRFLLESSQTDLLKAVCDKYSKIYQDKGWSIDVARGRMMNSQQDFDEVMHDLNNSMQLKDKQKLSKNNSVLQGLESKIDSIENDASLLVVGSDDVKKAFKETQRQTVGARLRLAILGDDHWREEFKYDPGSSDAGKLRTPDELLTVYKADLERLAKLGNQSS